jgi:hypothetical protein
MPGTTAGSRVWLSGKDCDLAGLRALAEQETGPRDYPHAAPGRPVQLDEVRAALRARDSNLE